MKNEIYMPNSVITFCISFSSGWKNFRQFIRDCELARDEVTALSAAGVFRELGEASGGGEGGRGGGRKRASVLM